MRIVCSSIREELALQAARELRARLVLSDAQIPGPAPLFCLRGRERAQIVIKASDRAAAVAAVAVALAQPLHREASVSVDVDPQ